MNLQYTHRDPSLYDGIKKSRVLICNEALKPTLILKIPRNYFNNLQLNLRLYKLM